MPTDSPTTGTTPSDPLGKNPFPEDDQRHQLWIDISLWAKEHLALFLSDMWNRMPEDAGIEEHRRWVIDLVGGQFGICARAISGLPPRTDQGARDYEQSLDQIIGIELASANNLHVRFVPKEALIQDIQAELAVQKQYYIGQMLKQVREAKEARRAQRAHDASRSISTKLEAESAAPFSDLPASPKTVASGSTSGEAEDQASAETLPLDPDERKAEYDKYKRACKCAGVEMTEGKLARLANRRWNTRDPIMKWKAGKDRPGDDERIRRAIRKGPPASQS